MEIRRLVIDLDRAILEINGQKVEEPMEVELPGPEGWPLRKLFNYENIEIPYIMDKNFKKLRVIQEEASKDAPEN